MLNEANLPQALLLEAMIGLIGENGTQVNVTEEMHEMARSMASTKMQSRLDGQHVHLHWAEVRQ